MLHIVPRINRTDQNKNCDISRGLLAVYPKKRSFPRITTNPWYRLAERFQ